MIEKEIEKFVADRSRRNAWLFDKNGKVYVRKATRFFQGNFIVMFDIASIEANVRGKGFFKTVRTAVEKMGCPIFIENVLEPRLADHLARNGYDMVVSVSPPCFFKSGNVSIEL